MHALARVLFHVQPRNSDALRAGGHGDIDPAMFAQRLVELGDLVALGQVGIEIILARKNRGFVDPAMQRHRRQRRELHRAPI